MKQTNLTVIENKRLADGIYRLRLTGDTTAITAPGQFVNLKLSGFSFDVLSLCAIGRMGK